MCFCDDVITNGSMLCRALVAVTAVLNACWEGVKVVGFCLSFVLVAIVLVILMVAAVRDSDMRLIQNNLQMISEDT